ncbi:membrane protein [Clostridia bacterium]|nr:membrane protein [Clostridia bacterium]
MSKTLRIAVLGIFIGILIAQTFVPFLGYLPIPPINPTIVHITVIVGAILYGRKIGAVLGFTWGLLSMLRAYVTPSIASFIFMNPIISVLPRLAVGIIVGLLYKFLSVKKTKSVLAYSACGIAGALVNTFLVLTLIYFLYRDGYAKILNVPVGEILHALLGIVLSNSIFEAIAAGIIVPAIVTPIKAIQKNKKIPSH